MADSMIRQTFKILTQTHIKRKPDPLLGQTYALGKKQNMILPYNGIKPKAKNSRYLMIINELNLKNASGKQMRGKYFCLHISKTTTTKITKTTTTSILIHPKKVFETAYI